MPATRDNASPNNPYNTFTLEGSHKRCTSSKNAHGVGVGVCVVWCAWAPISVLFLSLWGSSRGILVVFLKAGTLKYVRLEFSGPPISKAAGASHDSPRAQTCTFQGDGASKTPPKFHEWTPKRGRKNEIWGGKKKRAKIWAVRRRGSGGAVGGTAQILNTHTPATQHHTTQHTQHNTTHTTQHTEHTTQHTTQHKHQNRSGWPEAALA